LDLSAEQPQPTPRDDTCVQDLVIADMHTRKEIGVERYGTALQIHNGRDALRDLYEELLDGAMYVRQAIAERDMVDAGGAHHYLSTACLHGEHDYCKSPAGAAGPKKPAGCKFCSAPCRCTCHAGHAQIEAGPG